MRMRLACHPFMKEPEADPPVALVIPGLPPLPVALQRRVVKPSGYTLMVRVQMPGRGEGKPG